MLKRQERIMTSTVKRAYALYFNREVQNLDKNYVPNFCCLYCFRRLLGWLKGAPISMKFAVPMIWKEQQNHIDDCYFCLVNVSGVNRYKKRKLDYPDLRSAHRPLPHSDILPVPVPSEQKVESEYEFPQMDIENDCGSMSNKDENEEEAAVEAEESALLDSMQPKLID